MELIHQNVSAFKSLAWSGFNRLNERRNLLADQGARRNIEWRERSELRFRAFRISIHDHEGFLVIIMSKLSLEDSLHELFCDILAVPGVADTPKRRGRRDMSIQSWLSLTQPFANTLGGRIEEATDWLRKVF
jgi:hypothetical protein